jgi:hypothetical protein
VDYLVQLQHPVVEAVETVEGVEGWRDWLAVGKVVGLEARGIPIELLEL